MNDLIKLSSKQKEILQEICKKHNLDDTWFNYFITKIRYFTLYQTCANVIQMIRNYFKESTSRIKTDLSHYLDLKCPAYEVLPQIEEEVPSGFLF